MPASPLSVGFGPVAGPTFSPAQTCCPARLGSSPVAPPPPGAPATPGAGRPTRLPAAGRAAAASRSCQIRTFRCHSTCCASGTLGRSINLRQVLPWQPGLEHEQDARQRRTARHRRAPPLGLGRQQRRDVGPKLISKQRLGHATQVGIKLLRYLVLLGVLKLLRRRTRSKAVPCSKYRTAHLRHGRRSAIDADDATCPMLVQEQIARRNKSFGVRYVVSFALLLCALAGCKEETYTSTFRVPSPSGKRIALKTYSQLTPFKYTISIQDGADHTNAQPTPVTTGFVPGGHLGADAALLSWHGDDALDILIPTEGQATAIRESVGGLSLRYIYYDPKLPFKSNGPEQVVTLENVEYETSQNVQGKSIVCSLAVQGVDPKSSRKVGVVLSGFGTNLRHLQGEFGTFAAAFFVSNTPIVGQETLTLTRVQIDGVPIFDEQLAPVLGPLQSSTVDRYIYDADIKLKGPSEYQLVSYGVLQRPVVSALFERFRNGSLIVAYELGNGGEITTYLFGAPVNEESVRAYQGCEAKVRIFSSPVGSLLQNDNGVMEK